MDAAAIALLLALTGSAYDDDFSCEPWQGWWAGELTGDLDAGLVGEFYAFYAGAFTPGGGGSLNLNLRDVDVAGSCCRRRSSSNAWPHRFRRPASTRCSVTGS